MADMMLIFGKEKYETIKLKEHQKRQQISLSANAFCLVAPLAILDSNHVFSINDSQTNYIQVRLLDSLNPAYDRNGG